MSDRRFAAAARCLPPCMREAFRKRSAGLAVRRGTSFPDMCSFRKAGSRREENGTERFGVGRSGKASVEGSVLKLAGAGLLIAGCAGFGWCIWRDMRSGRSS